MKNGLIWRFHTKQYSSHYSQGGLYHSIHTNAYGNREWNFERTNMDGEEVEINNLVCFSKFYTNTKSSTFIV